MSDYLKHLEDPKEIHGFSREQLLELADEIRAKVSDYIVERAQIEFARDRGDII